MRGESEEERRGGGGGAGTNFTCRLFDATTLLVF